MSRQPSEGPLEHAIVVLLLTALPGVAKQTLQGRKVDGLADGVANGSHGLDGRATPTLLLGHDAGEPAVVVQSDGCRALEGDTDWKSPVGLHDRVRGVEARRAAIISSDMLPPAALAVFGAMDIIVDDEQ